LFNSTFHHYIQNFSYCFNSIDSRHTDIADDEVEINGLGHGRRFITTFRYKHLVTTFFKRKHKAFCNEFFIVNYEDLFFHLPLHALSVHAQITI